MLPEFADPDRSERFAAFDILSREEPDDEDEDEEVNDEDVDDEDDGNSNGYSE